MIKQIFIIISIFIFNFNIKDISFEGISSIKKNKKSAYIIFNKENSSLIDLSLKEFNKIFNILNETNLNFSEDLYNINCNEIVNLEYCKTLNFKDNKPLIYLYKGNNKYEFDLEINSGNFIKFVLKYLNILYVSIDKIDNWYTILENFKNLIIIYGENEIYDNLIKQLKNKIDDKLNVVVIKFKNQEILNYFNIKEYGLYFYVKEIKKLSKNLNEKKLSLYLDQNNFNNINELNAEIIRTNLLYKKHYIVYLYKKESIFEEELFLINDKLNKYKMNITSELGMRLKTNLGLKEENCLFIMFLDESKIEKYKYPYNELKFDLIKKFLEDFHNNKLEKYYKSEEIVNDNKYPKEIVGLDYEKEVLENNETVLVLIYAHYCQISKKVLEFYDDLSKEYKNIKFTKYNGSKNENPKVIPYKGFPTIVLYKMNKENKKTYIILKKNSVKEEIVKFLDENIPKEDNSKEDL